MTFDFNHLPMTGWYPGHMLKAGRQMQTALKLVDLVIELVDARAPRATRNPAFRKLLHGKPFSLVGNKADLADPAVSREWEECYRERGSQMMFLDSKNAANFSALVPAWREMVRLDRCRRSATRPMTRPVRVMIAGIPNVGKSTLVNRMAAAKKAIVGPKAGVTRQTQWIPLKGGVELLDTPGVLWPKIRNKVHELKLALVGSMKDEYVGVELLAEYLWCELHEQAERVHWDLYDLSACPATPDELVEAVGRRRGFLKAGGRVDSAQSATMLLNDFRDCKLGRISLDFPVTNSDE